MNHSSVLEEVLSRATEASKTTRVHGPLHWSGVAAAGYTLCSMTPEADAGPDAEVVLLFAMLHDSMRRGHGRDPDHGRRAAALARELAGRGDGGMLDLDGRRLDTLTRALEHHDRGETSEDVTVGTCWDADRLNLKRVGIRPHGDLMSTESGKCLTRTKDPSLFAGLRFSWRAIFLNFEALAGRTEGTEVYLRFGDLPENGVSHFWPADVEHGVSVFAGYEVGGLCRIDARRLLYGTETRLVRKLLRANRPLYVVDGRPCGMGGSGESVLRDARIVREVMPPERVEVLPGHPVRRECVRWWEARRRNEDAGPFPVNWYKELSVDRPATMSALYVESPADALRKLCDAFGQAESRVEAGKRKLLAGWGLLEEYDEMQAARQIKRRRKHEGPRIEDGVFWKETGGWKW